MLGGATLTAQCGLGNVLASDRQCYTECCAACVRSINKLQTSAKRFDDPLGGGQTNSGAAGTRAVEKLEDVGALCLRNSGTLVGDFNLGIALVRAACGP